MTENILLNLRKYGNLLILLLLIAVGGILGYLTATKTILALLLILLSIVILVTLYLFFKNGKLALNRIIIPLIIVAVLFPSIMLPAEVPAIRLELIIILIAWAFLLLGQLSKGEGIKLKWSSTNNWLLVFATCILISMAYAAFVLGYYPIGRDFLEFGKLIEYFLIFALIASLRIPPEQMRKYYIASLIIFLCSAAFGFAQYLNLFNINSVLTPYYAPTKVAGVIKYGQITGTTANPNEFGALMVLAASIALAGALWLKSKGIRLFSWLAFGVFSLTITFTLSRSALLSLLVVVIFIVFFKHFMRFGFSKTIRMLLLIVPLLIILSLITLQLVPEFFFVRIGNALDLSTDTSWQGRLVTWENQIDLWKQSPLFGWGPGKATMTTIVDNEWLLLLRRYGIFGLSVFLAMFIVIYYTLSKIARETENSYTETFCVSLQAAMLGYAVYMVPASVYHSLQLMPVFLIYLGLAYSQRNYLVKGTLA
jgi:O-antigen ligase